MGRGVVLGRGKSSHHILQQGNRAVAVQVKMVDADVNFRFARAELKHLLSALIGRYEFTLSRDAKTYYPAGIVTSKPANGMWVKLRKVEGW